MAFLCLWDFVMMHVINDTMLMFAVCDGIHDGALVKIQSHVLRVLFVFRRTPLFRCPPAEMKDIVEGILRGRYRRFEFGKELHAAAVLISKERRVP